MAPRRTRFVFVFAACMLLACISAAARAGAGGPSLSARTLVDSSPTPNMPPAIEQIASFNGGFSASVVAGTLAYVSEGSALTVLDVSAPQQPVRRARVPLTATPLAMAVDGTTLYIAKRASDR